MSTEIKQGEQTLQAKLLESLSKRRKEEGPNYRKGCGPFSPVSGVIQSSHFLPVKRIAFSKKLCPLF